MSPIKKKVITVPFGIRLSEGSSALHPEAIALLKDDGLTDLTTDDRNGKQE
jgi:hypothetical protein